MRAGAPSPALRFLRLNEMCGRFVSTGSAAAIAEAFAARVEVDDLGDRYNVAPTNAIYAVTGGLERVVRGFRWGLIPAWATDVSIGSKMINARAETLSEKRSFRPLLGSHRCLIPMDGFYEWGPGDGQSRSGRPRKQPYFIADPSGSPLAVAGLWTSWGSGQNHIDSATVITRAATGDVAAVHSRMPVMLCDEGIEAWLDPGLEDHGEVMALLLEADPPPLALRPVSTAVNNVRADGPALIEAAAADPVEPRLWSE